MISVLSTKNAQTILGTPDISLQPTLKCNPKSGPTSGFECAPYKQGHRLVQLSGAFTF